MVKSTKSAWERLQIVLESSGCKNLNNLGTALGLKRSETLYQIKRGNYEISKFLAKRIHEKFPQFSISWLYLGEDAGLSGHDQRAESPSQEILPLVCLKKFDLDGDSPDETFAGDLYCSQCVTGGASHYLHYSEDLLHPRVPANSLLLLREWNASIIWGRIYHVRTVSGGSYTRIVRKSSKSDQIKLTIARTSKKDDIYVKLSDIRSIHLVSGFVHLF